MTVGLETEVSDRRGAGREGCLLHEMPVRERPNSKPSPAWGILWKIMIKLTRNALHRTGEIARGLSGYSIYSGLWQA